MCSTKNHRVKDILELYYPSYLKDRKRQLFLTDDHHRAVNSIVACRTPRLGLQVFACDGCAEAFYLPRSCKHRFCSTCGAADTHEWANRVLYSLPDIRHHHVVFTVPKPLRMIASRNNKTFYDTFFRLSNEVIQGWFKEKHGLKAGVVSVLHTSGSDLKYHPHIHMIVSAGGLNKSGQLIELSGDYLCPQRVLGKRIRQRLISELVTLSKQEVELKDEEGKVYHLVKRLAIPKRLRRDQAFAHWLRKINAKHWIVNIEKSLPGVEKLIAYVGRYTKRSCISEYRLKSISGGEIEFSYKDYKNSKRGSKPVEATIKMGSTQFLDRLLLHIPEKGFKMVRYYGAYSSGNLKKIPAEKKLPPKEVVEEVELDLSEEDLYDYSAYRRAVKRKTGRDPLLCQCCGRLMKLRQIRYEKAGEVMVQEIDTS